MRGENGYGEMTKAMRIVRSFIVSKQSKLRSRLKVSNPSLHTKLWDVEAMVDLEYSKYSVSRFESEASYQLQ
jgi:hypothetical protein